MIHVHCTISSIKWDISLLTSEPPHINIPIPNEPSHPQHHFVRATLPGNIWMRENIRIFPVLPRLATDQSSVQFVSPQSSVSCLIPSPNSNLNGISDEYQNQIQVSQDKHGLDCILNEKRRIKKTRKMKTSILNIQIINQKDIGQSNWLWFTTNNWFWKWK